ncbi:EamA/RhaT family transporter [Candidatus Woesearchaeota archaeon]|nr:EamA/RhaT family transporter [Candidatus Woesearchaeota archaeon]
MLGNNKIGIFIMLFCTILTSLGQLFLKIGVDRFTANIVEIITNYWFWGGILFYGAGAILLIIALRYGELSLLYPVVSLSFVWVTLLSAKFLNETISALNIYGIVIILGGVSLIGIGAKNV